MARRSTTTPAKLEEVTDLEAESAQSSNLTLEYGLIFTTFLALLVGLVIAQLCIDKYFDMGVLS